MAYDKNAENNNSVVYLYSLGRQENHPGDRQHDQQQLAPSSIQDGKYLYFLSDRDFNEVLGNVDFEFANPKTTRIYIVTLRKDEPSPFPVLSDETQIKKEVHPDELTPPPARKRARKQAKAAKSKRSPKTRKRRQQDAETGQKTKTKKDEKEKPKEFRIDLDGIQSRIVALAHRTVPSFNTYLASKGFIYYSTTPIQGLSGPIPGESPAIHVYDLKERKDKVLIDGRAALRALLRRLQAALRSRRRTRSATPTASSTPSRDSPRKSATARSTLSGMRAQVDPAAEWKQIFNEVWRQERDYFYEAAMNGVDWEKMRDKYAQLLPSVADRYSLTYILGEMIGELSNSHTYVGGGDYPDLHPVNVGLLGRGFRSRPGRGMYRFKKIYRRRKLGPADAFAAHRTGRNVKEGDYLIAVNGRPLRTPQNPYELFVNTVNENVTLTVNSKPSEDGSHTVQVKPIADENNLRELAWVESNRKKVDAASNGRIGYVYLPDMGARA